MKQHRRCRQLGLSAVRRITQNNKNSFCLVFFFAQIHQMRVRTIRFEIPADADESVVIECSLVRQSACSIGESPMEIALKVHGFVKNTYKKEERRNLRPHRSTYETATRCTACVRTVIDATIACRMILAFSNFVKRSKYSKSKRATEIP